MSLSNKNIDKLVQEALAIEAEEAKDAGALGFMARILVQATMPHSKQDGHIFDRRNGDLLMSMMAHPSVGLPYGTIPRLLLAWLTTEAVRTKERKLMLGDSMSAFMRELGLVPTGGRWGSITRLKDQTNKLFSATIHCRYETDDNTKFINLGLVDSGDFWWQPHSPDQQTIWESSVTLSEGFFNEIIDRPVPVDMRALKALKQSPMALDVYTWLTYRLSYLAHQTEIPWEALQAQFGASYPDTSQGKRDFKKNLFKQLQKINVIYPEAKVSEGDYGLVLKPSKSHIKRLKVGM